MRLLAKTIRYLAVLSSGVSLSQELRQKQLQKEWRELFLGRWGRTLSPMFPKEPRHLSSV